MRAEFSRATKLLAWRRARGHCEHCGALLAGKVPHYDHINPAAFDGGNNLSNCQVLCVNCHDGKTSKQDVPAIAKSNRIRSRHAGIRKERTIRAWRKFDGAPVFKSRER
jgi:5-methylcytosine-specific restriction enzyme A